MIKMAVNQGIRKSPEPIDTTCTELMELMTGFEPVTSSLPRVNWIFRKEEADLV